MATRYGEPEQLRHNDEIMGKLFGPCPLMEICNLGLNYAQDYPQQLWRTERWGDKGMMAWITHHAGKAIQKNLETDAPSDLLTHQMFIGFKQQRELGKQMTQCTSIRFDLDITPFRQHALSLGNTKLPVRNLTREDVSDDQLLAGRSGDLPHQLGLQNIQLAWNRHLYTNSMRCRPGWALNRVVIGKDRFPRFSKRSAGF